MSEKVKHVAAAIKAKLLETQTRKDEISYEEIARDAIEAMREPTRAMEDAGISADGAVRPSCDHEVIVNPRRIWSAMINEALK